MYFQDLADKVKEAIWEGLRKDLLEDAKAEGCNVDEEGIMDEYIDNHINCNNNSEQIIEWIDKYFIGG
jgi:hypothetical protein